MMTFDEVKLKALLAIDICRSVYSYERNFLLVLNCLGQTCFSEDCFVERDGTRVLKPGGLIKWVSYCSFSINKSED